MSSQFGEYDNGYKGYCLCGGTGQISTRIWSPPRNYFRDAGNFSIDFWFASNGDLFEEDSDFSIQLVSDSTVVLNVVKEMIGSANYITLYDHNGYICSGFSMDSVLDGQFHHIALQLLKETQSLRMFKDGVFYYEEQNVSFSSYTSGFVDTINFNIQSEGSVFIKVDEFRIMDGINFSENFDPNEIGYPG